MDLLLGKSRINCISGQAILRSVALGAALSLAPASWALAEESGADAFDALEAEMRASETGDGAAEADEFDALEATLDDSAAATEDEGDEFNDPLEGMNRVFFRINIELDRYFLKPVARAYDWAVPTPIKKLSRNMLNNLETPVILLNDVLQGEFERAGITTARFGVNSTLGILGAADVAREFGLERHSEDFGQTLGVYGVPEGPYLFLPLLGPAPPRDLVGQAVDTVSDPFFWVGGDKANILQFTRFGVDIVDSRAANLKALDDIERTSIDYYATVRSLYRQSREGAINNGAIDVDDLPDIDELPDIEEFE